MLEKKLVVKEEEIDIFERDEEDELVPLILREDLFTEQDFIEHLKPTVKSHTTIENRLQQKREEKTKFGAKYGFTPFGESEKIEEVDSDYDEQLDN